MLSDAPTLETDTSIQTFPCRRARRITLQRNLSYRVANAHIAELRLIVFFRSLIRFFIKSATTSACIRRFARLKKKVRFPFITSLRRVDQIHNSDHQSPSSARRHNASGHGRVRAFIENRKMYYCNPIISLPAAKKNLSFAYAKQLKCTRQRPQNI